MKMCIRDRYSTYNRSLIPALRQNGLRVVSAHEDLTAEEAAFADEYFRQNVYPVLTPMAFDSSRPFPLIRNKTLNIAALLKKKAGKGAELEFAMVQAVSYTHLFHMDFSRRYPECE